MATGILTGTYRKADGTPLHGTVYITPSVPLVRDASGDVLLTGTVAVKLDDTGSFSVALIASDDSDLDPAGVTYKVSQRGLPSVAGVFIAAGTTVDMADVTPVDPDAPAYAAWTYGTGGGGGAGTITSVNGDAGPVVVLDAGDVGADPAGTAATAVAAHAGATDPHPQYLTAAEGAAAYDAIGAAATAVTAHTAATDPHPQYLTVAEGDAAYGRVLAVKNADGTVTLTVTGGGFVLVDNGNGTANLTLDGQTVTLGSGGGGGGAVASVNTKTGVVVLTASDVGLGNVTNTSDANKPVSTAQAAADAVVQAFAIQRTNHTGTQSADTLTDGTTNKAFLATERTKLTGIATAATANATDAQLRDRSTHTGTQAATTITGLGTAATVNTGTTSGTIPLLSTGGVLPIGRIATGTPDGTQFVRDDGTLAVPAGGGGSSLPARIVTPLVATRWYSIGPPMRHVNIIPPEAQEMMIPFVSGRNCTLTSAAVQCAVAGSTGAVLRFGIRNDAAGRPGTLIQDAGTIAAVTVAVLTCTMNATLVAGTQYWLTVTVQGGATTRPSLVSLFDINDPTFAASNATDALANTNYGWRQSGQTGALNTVASVPDNMLGNGPKIALSAAA